MSIQNIHVKRTKLYCPVQYVEKMEYVFSGWKLKTLFFIFLLNMCIENILFTGKCPVSCYKYDILISAKIKCRETLDWEPRRENQYIILFLCSWITTFFQILLEKVLYGQDYKYRISRKNYYQNKWSRFLQNVNCEKKETWTIYSVVLISWKPL